MTGARGLSAGLSGVGIAGLRDEWDERERELKKSARTSATETGKGSLRALRQLDDTRRDVRLSLVPRTLAHARARTHTQLNGAFTSGAFYSLTRRA